MRHRRQTLTAALGLLLILLALLFSAGGSLARRLLETEGQGFSTPHANPGPQAKKHAETAVGMTGEHGLRAKAQFRERSRRSVSPRIAGQVRVETRSGRPPVFSGAQPGSDERISLSPGRPWQFEVRPGNPGDLIYTWRLDDVPQPEDGPRFTWTPDHGALGDHKVELLVLDSESNSGHFAWHVTVPAPTAAGQVIETVVGLVFRKEGKAGEMYFDLGTGGSREGQAKFDGDGNLVFAESSQHAIRKLNMATGTITTIAGTGEPGLTGDGGPATQATLNQPNDVAIDPDGNIYISDTTNNCIRMVEAATGNIIRIGGDGTKDDGGDGGAVINATFGRPRGMAFDAARNLYISNSDKHTIRKVTYDAGLAPEQRIITRIAGGGADGGTGENVDPLTAQLVFPFGLHIAPDNSIYLAGWADSDSAQGHRARKIDAGTGKISTVAGTLASGFSGDGGAATAARMNQARGVVTDAAGNIYVADQMNNRIRKVDVGTGNISTYAGTGATRYSGDGGPATAAEINRPHGVTIGPNGHLYIMDRSNTIRKVDKDTGIITTIAGKQFAEGVTKSVEYSPSSPSYIARAPDGQMYFSNHGGHTVSRFNPDTGAITRVAGTGTADSNGNGGLATAAALYNPTGVAVDAAGNVYIAERYGHVVRKVDANTGLISVIAGITKTGGAGADGIAATASALNQPYGIAFDSVGDLYISQRANNRIRKVDIGTGLISTYWPGVNGARDIVFDAADNLYCAEAGGHVVRKKARADLAESVVAGGNGAGFSGDGAAATAAQLNLPYGVTFEAPDKLYIGDLFNNRIRRVDLGTGVISTYAGDGNSELGDGGDPEDAGLYYPMGLALDANGYLYVCDYGNNRVRRISPDRTDLSVGVTASPTSIAVGATSTATVTLQNAGPCSATPAVTVTLPAGLALQTATSSQGTFDSGTSVWTVGEVELWQQATLTLELQGSASGAATVLAELTASNRADPDSTPDNHAAAEDDQASVAVTVEGNSSDDGDGDDDSDDTGRDSSRGSEKIGCALSPTGGDPLGWALPYLVLGAIWLLGRARRRLGGCQRP